MEMEYLEAGMNMGQRTQIKYTSKYPRSTKHFQGPSSSPYIYSHGGGGAVYSLCDELMEDEKDQA